MAENVKRDKNFFALSLKGIGRLQNQDARLVIQSEMYDVFAVFDGVGSAKNAKKATQMAAMFIRKYHERFLHERIRLSAMIAECNDYIVASNLIEPFSTVCIVVILKHSEDVFYISVGDSRIYLVTNQYIEQISKDDKVSDSNVLNKCLGMAELGHGDFEQKRFRLERGFLALCTDGFYSLMEKNKLLFFNVLNKKRPSTIRENLRKMIKGNNLDDATLLVIK
ncbi:PP2C family protein-serine/threonine phosphatase [Chryseolinea lacunae]|uniref:Protein serine/threonine phosphatase 2C family protein n=1 Tax=Chryseolinea lacunae TaxID=2801331 RepID=A0ABS1KTZ9_9BACT|nr:PP2C family protein-serine/threonine phosphatase [Chryseolinea lacunae]MBL0742742.1 protein serine/threonine phosphatase 2C family protein [Chryseolinea lacunae]